jgi:hypothetical protein
MKPVVHLFFFWLLKPTQALVSFYDTLVRMLDHLNLDYCSFTVLYIFPSNIIILYIKIGYMSGI